MNANYAIPGEDISLWLDTTPNTNYATLDKEVTVDVAVIGGGISGLTSAYLLSKAGKKVALIESHKIAEATTGNTTAKITSAHGLIYDYLINEFGQRKAQIYAEANQTAIEFISELVAKKNIECDFQRIPAFIYAALGGDIKSIEDEVEAAASLGLPVHFTLETPLPFPVDAAIRYEDQAMFHPRKYLLYLSEEIQRSGSNIYENTKTVEIEEDRPFCKVITDKRIVNANDIIIATNYPIYDPNLFFARLTARQSFVFAAQINEAIPEGLFYSTEKSFHSLRPYYSNGKKYLLVGGEVYRTGQKQNTAESYQRLEKWARKNFSIKSFDYHWTTNDSESYDRVPFIGPLTPRSKHLYVATGYSGWGMAHGTVAGMILSDLIVGKKNPWLNLYNPSRFKSYLSANAIKQNVSTVGSLIKDKISAEPKIDLSKLAKGEAKVFDLDGEKVAVYKNESGQVYSHSAVCTHMGCTVGWNNAEKTWDCPCHGSRYNFKGEVFHGPARRDLRKINV